MHANTTSVCARTSLHLPYMLTHGSLTAASILLPRTCLDASDSIG
jgi:hypothetical protein